MSNMDIQNMTKLMQDFVKDWYFGNLSREDATRLLFLESDGTYLIRDCNQIPGSYVLMVKEKTYTNKYVLSPSGNNWKIGNSEFASIESILKHFSKNIIRQSTLSNPVPKYFYRAIYDYQPINDIELKATTGELFQFVLRYNDFILCHDNSKHKRTGWLPAKILKQSSNDSKSVQDAVFKIKRLIPFKTICAKSRNPSVFDKYQLPLKVGEILAISDVLEDGMLKASKEDGREGLVPFNMVRMMDLKLED